MPDVKQCVMGVKNETRIESLENDFSEIKSDVKEIKDKLLKRPSWFVTILLTAMSSTIVFLIMELVKGG